MHRLHHHLNNIIILIIFLLQIIPDSISSWRTTLDFIPRHGIIGNNLTIECSSVCEGTIDLEHHNKILNTSKSIYGQNQKQLIYFIKNVSEDNGGDYYCGNGDPYCAPRASKTLIIGKNAEAPEISCILMDAKNLNCCLSKNKNDIGKELIIPRVEQDDLIKFDFGLKPPPSSNDSYNITMKNNIFDKPCYIVNNWSNIEVNGSIKITVAALEFSKEGEYHNYTENIKKPSVNDSQLIHCGDRQATVRVTTTATENKYLVNISCSNNQNPNDFVRQTDKLTEEIIFLTNLTPASQYNCTIYLHFTDGKGLPSDSINLTFKTEESIPSAPPTLLPALFKTNSTVTFYFTPVNETMSNGQIIRYEYNCDDEDNWNNNSQDNLATNGSITCSLNDSTRKFINIQLKACTRIGCNSFPARRNFSLTFESSGMKEPEFRIISEGTSHFLLTEPQRTNSFLLICRRITLSMPPNECSSSELLILPANQSRITLPPSLVFFTSNGRHRDQFALWNKKPNLLLLPDSWTSCAYQIENGSFPDLKIYNNLINHHWPTAWTKIVFNVKIPSCKFKTSLYMIQSIRLEINCPSKSENISIPTKNGSLLMVDTFFTIESNNSFSDRSGCFTRFWLKRFGNTTELLWLEKTEPFVNKVNWIWWFVICLGFLIFSIWFVVHRYLQRFHLFKKENSNLTVENYLFDEPLQEQKEEEYGKQIVNVEMPSNDSEKNHFYYMKKKTVAAIVNISYCSRPGSARHLSHTSYTPRLSSESS